MAINFPTSPSTNDTHTTSGGTTYLWDGTSWKAQGTTSQYTLPTASSTVLGGIKIGSRLTISSGVLEADVQGGTTVFTGLTDTPSSLTAGKWLKVNAGGTAIEETDPPSAQGLSPRGTASGTSASLAAGASGNLDINGVAKSYGILKITTSSAAWVTLYTSQTARTNDTSRAATTDPVPGSGVVAEVITSGDTTQVISPMLCGYNDESTPVDTVYAKVRNETIGATTITVTLTFVPLEA